MLCPICENEMEATGGVPTIWLCRPCTAARKSMNPKNKPAGPPEVYFKGDGVNTLEAI